MALGYAIEQFSSAVHALATSTDPLADRLVQVLSGQLMRIQVDGSRDIEDPEVRAQVAHLLETCSAFTGREGAFRETVSAMTEEALREVIGEILTIHRALLELRFRQ